MPFDALTIAALKNELNEIIINGRIEKIFQPQKDLIFLNVFHPFPRRSLQLLLSANSRFTRCHLVSEKPTNPTQPPAFCMLMRKYLQGGRILRIKQPSWERILHLEVENLHPDHGLITYSIIFEAMGRFSNIVLIDHENRIIDALKRFPQGSKGVREIFPGQKYIAPPTPAKFNPSTIGPENLKIMIDRSPSDRPLQKILIQEIMGISTYLALEILSKTSKAGAKSIDPQKTAGEIDRTEIDLLFDVLKSFHQMTETSCFSPTISKDEAGAPIDVFAYCPTSVKSKFLSAVEEINQGIELTLHQQSKKSNLDQRQEQYKKIITAALKKTKRKWKKQKAEWEKAEDADLFKLFGELLTVHQNSVPRGAHEIELENYYDANKKITVPLDPSLGANENAQKYFKRYNKAKKGRIFTNEQLAKTETEINYLESLENVLQDLLKEEELAEVQEELYEAGLLKKDRKKVRPSSGRKSSGRRRPSSPVSKPHEYISSSGYKILVGRNNRQNDLLTMKKASPDDIWFHTQKIPGSHVVIRTEGKTIDEETILEAAKLAAYYSKARNSTKVPVDYTEKRYVRKPTGSKPGFVLYENFKTIIVNPDPDLIKKFERGSM